MLDLFPIMSHLGKKPIEIPEGVIVEMKDDVLNIAGKEGNLSQEILPFMDVKIDGQQIIVKPTSQNKQAKSNWGTMTALTRNAINDVTNKFSKSLIIEGIGYRANAEGQKLVLNIGYSHPVEKNIPDSITLKVEKNSIKLSGIDRQLVGKIAAEIRKIRKPEPYKGKGIRYSDEIIRKKAGKKATA